MTIPVAFTVSEFPLRDGRILVDGEPARRCFSCNEAEGWADVWTLNEQDRVISSGGTVLHHRLHGVVTVETDPQTRAFLEAQFPASQTAQARTICDMTETFFRKRRNATPSIRAQLARDYLAAIGDVLASLEADSE